MQALNFAHLDFSIIELVVGAEGVRYCAEHREKQRNQSGVRWASVGSIFQPKGAIHFSVSNLQS